MVKRRRDAYEGDIVMNREHVCPELKIVFHHKLFLKGKVKMKKVKQLFIVSGAMGVGKSTIAKILMARKSDTYIILKGSQNAGKHGWIYVWIFQTKQAVLLSFMWTHIRIAFAGLTRKYISVCILFPLCVTRRN